jgi:hypothetical protein
VRKTVLLRRDGGSSMTDLAGRELALPTR